MRDLISGVVALSGCALILGFGATGAWSASAEPARVQSADAVTTAAGVIRGRGARVVSTTIARNSPVVITATHNGSSNFIVHFVGGGDKHYVVNEIGRYNGQAVIDRPKRGKYRIAVQADGAWTLKITQPTPNARAKLLPGTLSGRGAKVVAVRTTRNMQPIVTASHQGQSNFIVHLIGYGKLTGTEYVINEIGRYRGQALIDRMPSGTYLVWVQADGAWTLRFAP
jgi:uncharacterized protein YdbL (DUF1318 family)